MNVRGNFHALALQRRGRAENARCGRPDGELQKKTKPRLEGGGVLSSDAMIALNWFMRSRIGIDAVALTLEGHRRPREVLEVRRRQWDRGQLRDRQS
jgi:hypothetical protein